MIYVQSILALLFVLGLILALYAFFQRLEGRLLGVKTRRLQVVESVSLGDKRRLLLVRVEKQCFLVGATGQHLSLLSSIEAVEESVKIEANCDSIPNERNNLQLNLSEAR